MTKDSGEYCLYWYAEDSSVSLNRDESDELSGIPIHNVGKGLNLATSRVACRNIFSLYTGRPPGIY